jgi:hypothetical protein
MADDDPPDLSSLSENDPPDARRESPSAEPPAAHSPHRLPYAPVFPNNPPGPIALDYGGPAARSGLPPHPLLAFIGGMFAAVILPVICLVPLARSEPPLIVAMVLMLATPVVMLCFRNTRFLGLGWLTTYALGFSALFIICGR